MAKGDLVAYYRVSTTKQGQSGLGLEAQRAAVAAYLNGGVWRLLSEFTEVETAKKATLENRPQLRAALDQCKRDQATLVIAKLDRLARNVHFVSGLIESRVEFVAVDMPHANKVMLQMHAVMCEWERDQISRRTRDALSVAKARGVKLGSAGPANLRRVNDHRRADAQAYAHTLRSVLDGFQGAMSQRQIVDKLNELKLPSQRGGRWHLKTLQRVLARLSPTETIGP